MTADTTVDMAADTDADTKEFWTADTDVDADIEKLLSAGMEIFDFRGQSWKVLCGFLGI